MKSHNENIPSPSLYDVVAAVDKVQKHTESRILTESDLKLSLRALGHFAAYGDTQVTVWGGYAPPFFKYAVPCTVLTLTSHGGNVRRTDAPIVHPGEPFHRVRVRIMRSSPNVIFPRAVLGFIKLKDMPDDWVEYVTP